MKILVIQSALLRETELTEALETSGHVVLTVPDAATAWQNLVAQVTPEGDGLFRSMFDALILPWQTPELTGPDLCRLVRSPQSRLTGLHILIQVPEDTLEYRLMVREAGANDYINSPLNTEELMSRVALIRGPIPKLTSVDAPVEATPNVTTEVAPVEATVTPIEATVTPIEATVTPLEPIVEPISAPIVEVATPKVEVASPKVAEETKPGFVERRKTPRNKPGEAVISVTPQEPTVKTQELAAEAEVPLTVAQTPVAPLSVPVAPLSVPVAPIPIPEVVTLQPLPEEGVLVPTPQTGLTLSQSELLDIPNEVITAEGYLRDPNDDLRRGGSHDFILDDNDNNSEGHNLPRTLKMGELLLKQKVLTEEQLGLALEEQKETFEKLGKIIVNHGWATEEEVVRAYSYQTEMPFVYVGAETVADTVLSEFPREVVETQLFLPLLPDTNEGLNAPYRVAICDPWNIKAIDLVRGVAPGRVIPVLATEKALREEIKNTYAKGIVQQHLTQRTMIHTISAMGTTEDSRKQKSNDVNLDTELLENDDQAPVIRFINTVIADGVRRRASDIHVEPYKRDFQVRYRIDGDMIVAHTLPMSSYPALSSRIKIMSDLDIAERRVPQDGRIAITIDNRSIQLRVSTLPNQYGERVVLRVLDSAKADLGMEKLEFSNTNSVAFQKLIKNPYGIIMVTGPTGSGKTTTLYAALTSLKSPETNIMTCEDPIEYEIDRISQSNINPKAGLTFAAQLRAILRQDPDVVLVGEIRDAETAEIAMRAAMTGHLVLSTLHCNEAAGAPSRLIDMGVAPFLISSAIVGTVAQRLVKRICPHCRVQVAITPEQRQMVQSINRGEPFAMDFIYEAPGCDKCGGTGTTGRMGVHEVMTVNEEIQRLAMQNAATSQVRDAAIRNGMVTMAQDGIIKVREGKTMLLDVMKKVMMD